MLSLRRDTHLATGIRSIFVWIKIRGLEYWVVKGNISLYSGRDLMCNTKENKMLEETEFTRKRVRINSFRTTENFESDYFVTTSNT